MGKPRAVLLGVLDENDVYLGAIAVSITNQLTVTSSEGAERSSVELLEHNFQILDDHGAVDEVISRLKNIEFEVLRPESVFFDPDTDVSTRQLVKYIWGSFKSIVVAHVTVQRGGIMQVRTRLEDSVAAVQPSVPAGVQPLIPAKK